MTRNEAYEIAADICAGDFRDGSGPNIEEAAQAIYAAITAAILEEREACAQIADDYYHSVNPEGYEAAYKTVTAREIRERIRARSED